MNASVTIIVPVYNAESTIRLCVESILKQTYRELEVLLIDDASVDASRDLCDEYAAKDSRVKVFSLPENRGPSAARNLGIQYASGEYLLFSDADDTMEPNSVDVCVTQMQRYSADMLCFGYRTEEQCYRCETLCELTPLEAARSLLGGGKCRIKGYLWNKCFKTAVIKKEQLRFDETAHLCEDVLFCQQYVRVCKKIVCIPEVLYHYRLSDDSITRTRFNSNICTVFHTYARVVATCSEYGDKDLVQWAKANMYSHYILNLRRIKKELTPSERKEYKYIYTYVRQHFFSIMTNRYIRIKRKALTLWLLLSTIM